MIWLGVLIGIGLTLGFSYVCHRFVEWDKKRQEDKEFESILKTMKGNV